MIKGLLTFSFALFCHLALTAQEIPNHSFESWSGGDPVDWLTTDISGFDAVSQSSDAYANIRCGSRFSVSSFFTS